LKEKSRKMVVPPPAERGEPLPTARITGGRGQTGVRTKAIKTQEDLHLERKKLEIRLRAQDREKKGESTIKEILPS